jgi:hypothetical protein
MDSVNMRFGSLDYQILGIYRAMVAHGIHLAVGGVCPVCLSPNCPYWEHWK